MERVKSLFKSMVSLLLGGLLVTSCQSEDFSGLANTKEDGKLSLDLSVPAGFEADTKAVNEAEYRNSANYIIEIKDGHGNTVKNGKYSELGFPITLPLGEYKVKASYGTESNASRTAFYVVGQASVSVDGGTTGSTAAVSCKPTCGKFIVNFDATMATYFSDYFVTYKTEALGSSSVVWGKADVDPWYLKLNENGETVKAVISVTRKSDSKSTTVEKELAMTPNQAWTLNVSATYTEQQGSLGLTIVIDDGVTTQEIPVEIPSEWT